MSENTNEITSAASEGKQAPVFDKSVCLIIKLGRPRTRRSVKTGQVDTGDADATLVKVGKEILDSKELKQVGAFDMMIRAYLKSKALPAPIRMGAYMVSIANVPEVNAEIESLRVRRNALIDKFIASYPEKVEAALVRLGHLGNRSDYPSPEAMRDLFVFETEYVTFGTPAALKQISVEFFQQEEARAREKWTEAGEQMKGMLVAEFSALIGHAADKLVPAGPGEPKKVFHKSAIEKIESFMKEFKGRDIFDYADLDKLVQKAKGVMSGVDVDSLRKDNDARMSLASSFGAIKEDLDKLVVNKPRRLVELDDEE